MNRRLAALVVGLALAAAACTATGRLVAAAVSHTTSSKFSDDSPNSTSQTWGCRSW